MKKLTAVELRLENARLRRENGAHSEWFTCEKRKHSPAALDIRDGAITCHVYGLARASGGVVVVYERAGDWYHAPVYLDDLVIRWQQHHEDDLRGAARALLAMRERCYALPKVSP